MNVKGYEKLAAVLTSAYEQAAVGKGAERHANDLPFHEQPMQKIAARRGIGFILGQADKKSEEAQGMLGRGERDAAIRELLGAIVYLAGAVIFVQGYDAAVAVAANDNRPQLPEGFLPWDPTWIEKGVAQPPAIETVAEAMRRDGICIIGKSADWWEPSPNYPASEIVGYKLHG